MTIIEKDTLGEAYKELIERLLDVKSQDGATKELLNCSLVINKPSSKDLIFPYRTISSAYAKAELEWYWKGSNSCEEIGKHAKMWLKLTDDGVTNNSAYGYILLKKYGFNQIEQIIDLLKKDPNSRRAVLNISDPAIDRIKTHDMQCTIALQFVIRDGALEETVYMRSNDVYFGFPYDYIFFISIGEYIAKSLGITLAKYTHTATSMHMYLRDVDKFFERPLEQPDVDVTKIQEEFYEK